MNSTNFYHDNGSISSIRTSSGGISSASYIGSMKGGSTFSTGNVLSRISSNGSYLGSGIRIGNGSSYFSASGHPSSHITSYR
jgi:hypothetical protein